MHRHTLAPIERARVLLDEERAQVRAERAAFESFAERVVGLEPEPGRSQGPTASPSLRERSAAAPRSSAATRIRTAYRETVMAVGHYDAVYDEPIATNLTAELGPGIAAALRDDVPVTPMLHRAIVTGVKRAIHDRRAFLEVLDAERASLDHARAEGREIVTRLSELSERATTTTTTATNGARETVDALADRCARLVESRQHRIQERSVSRYIDGHDLCAYLYADGPDDWTYPVLTVAVSLQRDIDAVRRRLDREGSAPT
ncbi:hypothetical protein ACFQPA_17065 [Halomarina halobia]|uniref:DUF7260 domain-containing protein n=1 Tax=Halomarina halobia TaxID=3033386 RepID=A0ABD6AFQ1_9EURY|nr:hypothetical protein [Halomarina sp. PSR21]